MFGWLSSLWEAVVTPIVTVVTAVVETVVTVVATVVDTVVDIATDVVTEAAHFVLDPIGLGGVADALDVAEAYVDGFVDGATDLAVEAVELTSDALDWAVDAGSDILELNVPGVLIDAGQTLNWAGDVVSATFGNVVDAFENSSEGVVDVVVGEDGLVDDGGLLEPITDTVYSVIGGVTGAVGSLVDGVNEATDNFLFEPITDLGNNLDDAYNEWEEDAGDPFGWTGGFADETIEEINECADDLADDISEVGYQVEDAADDVMDWWDALWA